MMALLASLLTAAAPVVSAPAVVPAGATAAELVASCRTMIPETVEVEGRIVLRSRKGIVQAEHAYVLKRDRGRTELLIDGAAVEPPAAGQTANLLGTDVTWSDITLDYLWWDDFAFDTEHEAETVHGQKCNVILLKKDARAVRVWVDRKTGAMLQAEELQGEKAVRRLWGTRIKKFDERWMPSQLEVETLGVGHRTKITVEKLK